MWFFLVLYNRLAERKKLKRPRSGPEEDDERHAREDWFSKNYSLRADLSLDLNILACISAQFSEGEWKIYNGRWVVDDEKRIVILKGVDKKNLRVWTL